MVGGKAPHKKADIRQSMLDYLVRCWRATGALNDELCELLAELQVTEDLSKPARRKIRSLIKRRRLYRAVPGLAAGADPDGPDASTTGEHPGHQGR